MTPSDPSVPDSGRGELLPCPFCGGPGRQYHRNEGDGWSNTDWVCCENEDCSCQTCLHETPALALAAWNRRAVPEAALAAARQQAIEECAKVIESRKPLWEEAEAVAAAVRRLALSETKAS